MRLKSLLLGTSLLALAPFLAHASDVLQPRAEVGVKAGSERSVLTTEFWAPLAQKSDRVVYTDLRLMGDNDENREGNLGFGYRQLSERTNSVLGVHGWIDRRRTEYNNTFHAVTLGVESLGSSIDLRANGYIALGGSETAITPNLGPTTPYLAGTGLFYNTNGSVTETPQHGVDAEAGYRLPILEKHVDTVRVYGGGYHFFRSNTDNVTGIRLRTEAQINPALSVGARFQHDGPRGSQGFLEATLKFPFSAKKMFRKSGLRARLDESPERDIDIVTGAKVDNGQRQIQNSEGSAQRILYVDNTNTQSGDGSYENPFNTLKAAEAALKANDILYVKAGNGTTTGMDQGINITQSGVSLIGSGSALTVGGITFLNAGSAPVITNTDTTVSADASTGNAIYVTGGDANITGLTISNAYRDGIRAYFNGSQNFGDFSVTNITGQNNGGRGLFVYSNNNALLNNVIANNNAISGGIGTDGGFFGRSGRGIEIRTEIGSHINNVVTDRNNIHDNQLQGLVVQSQTASSIDNITITNNDVAHTINAGSVNMIVQVVGGSKHKNIVIDNNIANNASASALNINANGSVIENLTISGFSATNAVAGAIAINVNNGTTAGRIDNLNLSNISTSNNTLFGVSVQTSTGGTITQTSLNNITANNNTQQGIILRAATSGSFSNVALNNIITTGNTLDGIRLESSNTGSVINQLSVDNITALLNLQNGINMITTGGLINSATFTNVTARNNLQNGLSALATTSGTIGQMNINSSLFSNNTLAGISETAQNSGIIGQAQINNVIANNNAAQGIYIVSQSAGGIGQVGLQNISMANNNRGLNIAAIGAGSYINQETISSVVSNNNTIDGLLLTSESGANVGSMTVTNITASNNSRHGIYILSQASAQLGTVSVSNATTNSNAQSGINLLAQTAGKATSATIANSTANSNNLYGIGVSVQDSGSILGNLSVTGTTTNSNAITGVFLQTANSGVITQSTVNNITSTLNTFDGLRFNAAGGTMTQIDATNITGNNNGRIGIYTAATSGTIGTLNLSNSAANTNTANGIQIQTSGTGVINNANLIGLTANNNVSTGFYINAANTSVLNNVSLSSNNTLNNGNTGVFVDDDTSGTFLVDLGGGTLSSVGLNRSFGNTNSDIRVDLDGGQLKARNNWWGVNTGLAVGRISYEDASTIDATNFLTTDPRP